MKERVNWDNKHIDYVSIFIDKREMDEEFEKSKNCGVWTNRAGELIITLTENICFSNYFNIDNSQFIITEAMVDYVIMYILENGLRLWEKEKGTAFSYFSRVVFTKAYGFLRDRYGEKRRLDLYGKKIKYRIGQEWFTYDVLRFNEELHTQEEEIDEE